MGPVVFAYLMGLLLIINATAVPYVVLQVANVVAGIWFIFAASISGWQHFNRD